MKTRSKLLSDPNLFSGLIEAAMDAIVIIDDRMHVIVLNPIAQKMFGYKPDEVIGQPLEMLMPTRFRDSHATHVQKFSQEAATNRRMGALGVVMGLHKDGREMPLEASISKVTVSDHNFYTAILRDITERLEHEKKIARLTRLHAVQSGINNAIVRIRDRKELFDEACLIAVELGNFPIVWISTYDMDTQEITAVAWHGIDDRKMSFSQAERKSLPLGPNIVGRLYRTREPVIINDVRADKDVGGVWRKEVLQRGLHSVIGMPLMMGDTFAGTLIMYASGENYFDSEELVLITEVAGDISFALSYMENQKKLAQLAFYDSLTGLPNHDMFLERLSSYIDTESSYSRKVAVLIMDLDRFRAINNTLGRHAGDNLLKQIAMRFERNPDNKQLRHARLGADTFAIVIPNVKDQDDVVQRINSKLERYFGTPFKIGESELTLSAKFGAALFPDDGADAETLFRNAEVALKKAKVSGEHYLFYSEHMNEHVAERLTLENKLLRAIRNEEFVLYYQPKIALETRRITGVEALIRWKDPKNGLIPPAEFIPLLEETGLILEVGPWVLRQAIHDYELWLKAGLAAPRIAVNVSAIQLHLNSFVEDLLQAITAGPLPTGIDLEITESFLMEDIDGNIAKLLAIREMGISISVDDFGTGYSSLAYLAKLPVQILKIDRSFISKMLEDPSAMTLVSTIISLAHSLQLKVVAEGVESEEQAKILHLLRCDEMQGYLFSKPVPFEEMSQLLSPVA